MKVRYVHGSISAMEFLYTPEMTFEEACEGRYGTGCRVVLIDGIPHVRIGAGCELWQYHSQESIPPPRGITLDSHAGTLSFAGNLVSLTNTQFRIVAALAAAREPLSYEALSSVVWNGTRHDRIASLRSHIHMIRTKLLAARIPDQLIENVRGFGFRLASWALA